MPTATPFKALGAGNGFRSCIYKVNVSNYDYWTTFSGVNKNNPTTSDALIQESLALAMKLYWNLSGFRANTFYNTTYGVDTSVSSATIGVYDEVGSAIEPVSRVCNPNTSLTSGTIASTSDPNGSRLLNSQLKGVLGIVRMYNGDVGDEGNFIGYGAGEATPYHTSTTYPFYFVGSYAGTGRLGAGCYVTLGGYMDEQPVTAFTQKYEYVVVEGSFHFACAAGASNFYETPTVIPSSLLASVSFQYNNGSIESSQAHITGFDFYTY